MSGREVADQANRRTLKRLGLVALGMFGFGYAMVPLYYRLCEATGIGGKTGRTDVQAAASIGVDRSRTVTVEFMGASASGLPWEFRPMVPRMEVHPGETYEVKYYVRNQSGEKIVAQAIPSVTPYFASTSFKKIECFCFTQQSLTPGESREMPVRFVVEPTLDASVKTVTLSYAFFNTDKAQAAKYGNPAVMPEAAHDHAAHGGAHAAPGG